MKMKAGRWSELKIVLKDIYVAFQAYLVHFGFTVVFDDQMI